jgi:hypothetical protein
MEGYKHVTQKWSRDNTEGPIIPSDTEILPTCQGVQETAILTS